MAGFVSERNDRRSVVLYVIGIFAMIVTLLTLGKNLPFPNASNLSVALEGPTGCDSDGQNTVVVDNQGHRVLITNSALELVRVLNYDVQDRPIDAVTDVCVTDKTVYVAGVVFEEDNDVIIRERVLAYGLYNSSPTEVYALERPVKSSVPRIKTLSDADGDVLITVFKDWVLLSNADNLTVVRANRHGQEDAGFAELGDVSVYDAGVEINEGIVTVSQIGEINDGDDEAEKDGVDEEGEADKRDKLKNLFFTSVDVNEDGTVFVTEDNSRYIHILEDDYTLNQALECDELGYSAVRTNKRMLCASNTTYNEVLIHNIDSGETLTIGSVRISAYMICMLLVVWLSRLFLVFLLLRFAIRRVRIAFATGDTHGMGGLIAAFFTIVGVSALIGYSAFVSYQTSLRTRGQEIMMLSDIIDVNTDGMGELLGNLDDRTKLHDDGEEGQAAFQSIFQVSDVLENISRAAQDNGIGTYYYIYGKDDLGVYSLYDGSFETVMGTSSGASSDLEGIESVFAGNREDDLHIGHTLRDESFYRLVPIPSADGDDVVGVIEFGSRVRSFVSKIMMKLTENSVVMLVVLFVVYVCYVELRFCGRCLIDYQQLRDVHKKRDAVALLTRPYTFLITMLISCDAVMSTLIGRSMLTSSGLSTKGLLITLPAVMQGIGLVVGQIAYGSLAWRVGARRLICGFCALMSAIAAFTFLVVVWSNFSLYLVAKFLLGIPFGLLYTLGYSLPRQARDDEIRVQASGGVRRTDTSAAAMGTIMGGFVARFLGNEWVYVLVAVGAVVVLVFSLKLFLRHAMPLEFERRGVVRGFAAIRSFLLQRDTVALVLLLMLPVILAGGYSSLLFPVFSSNLGATSSAISYIVVLGQLVVYVSIDTIDYLDANYGKWKVGVAAVALLAGVFLLFSINTRLTWAVVAIALVGVFTKMGDAWKALWVKQAAECGVPLGRATGSMFAMRSVLLVVQPVLLGALLNVSDRIAAILLGIVCLTCVVAFVVLTRKSRMRI